MGKVKDWISALRPRTLFLAVSTSLCGSGIAYSTGKFNISICILTMLIATILQLLSNMANDLGDYQHGTDITGERVGPKRAVQSGAITSSQMKRGIMIAVIAAFIVGGILIYEALKFMPVWIIVLFLFLGLLSIIAALKYTAGKNPYGYKGLGDIFSFVFFGLVSVIGTYYLHTHTLDFRPLFPSIGMGLFTVSVLNVNNMRDMDNDMKSGKITVAIKLGIKKAKQYHILLVLWGMICFICYNLIYSDKWYQYLYMISFVLFFFILKGIVKTKDKGLLDPYLKYTSMTTFLLSLLFVICINL